MSKTAPVLTALIVALALAGCGTDSRTTDGDTGGDTGVERSAASSSATSTSSTPPSPTSSSIPAGPGRCTLADLKVALGRTEGAAGSTLLPVGLTNTSDSPCRTGGFGGVSLVTSPRSEPVGAPADRAQKDLVKPLVLQPGAHAEATLRITNAENFPSNTCQPEQTEGLRVFAPNETNAAYVPHPATACASTKVHLLELRPYQAG